MEKNNFRLERILATFNLKLIQILPPTYYINNAHLEEAIAYLPRRSMVLKHLNQIISENHFPLSLILAYYSNQGKPVKKLYGVELQDKNEKTLWQFPVSPNGNIKTDSRTEAERVFQEYILQAQDPSHSPFTLDVHVTKAERFQEYIIKQLLLKTIHWKGETSY